MQKMIKEKGFKYVCENDLVVQVPVELVYSLDEPHSPYYEPETIKRLDEIVEKCREEDMDYLFKVGKVFKLIEEDYYYKDAY